MIINSKIAPKVLVPVAISLEIPSSKTDNYGKIRLMAASRSAAVIVGDRLTRPFMAPNTKVISADPVVVIAYDYTKCSPEGREKILDAAKLVQGKASSVDKTRVNLIIGLEMSLTSAYAAPNAAYLFTVELRRILKGSKPLAAIIKQFTHYPSKQSPLNRKYP
ncbi:hypothetical protein VpasPP24_12 [Vibrio phage Vpas_PP24]|nr:hypothetical protein VpasPP24_12 [Vibrio phage Vpas_PP24]